CGNRDSPLHVHSLTDTVDAKPGVRGVGLFTVCLKCLDCGVGDFFDPMGHVVVLCVGRNCAQRHCPGRSEEHTSELQSRFDLVCRLLLEKKKHLFETQVH